MRKTAIVSIAVIIVSLLVVLAGCGIDGGDSGSDTGAGSVDSTGKARIIEFTQPG